MDEEIQTFSLSNIGDFRDDGVYKVDLSDIGISFITSITIFDDQIISGGDGAASGFDLDYIALSSVDTISPTAVSELAENGQTVDVFDFVNGVVFTPGFSRNPTDPRWDRPNLFGTTEDNRYSPLEATLDVLEAQDQDVRISLTSAGLSLGEGGSVTFTLTQPVASTDLFLYLADIGGGNDTGFVAFNIDPAELGVSLQGTTGDDTIILGEGQNAGVGQGNDSIDGGRGDDLIDGSLRNDTLKGGEGDDTLLGNEGIDTAQFDENRSTYTLQLGPDISVIARSGDEGTDQLSSIERLSFPDQDFDLSRFDDIADLTQAQFTSFAEMYIAYFNRAPDAEGLMFWANAFATGTSLGDIASFFATSVEAQLIFPDSATPEAFVSAVYDNVLGRTSDSEGFEFWTSVLADGRVSQGEFVLAILEGARAAPPADATQDFIDQQVADRAYLDQKTDIGLYFSAILGMSDLGNATEVMELFNGTESSILAARAAADEYYATALGTDADGEFLIQVVGVVDDPFL
ncbi:DUF4214 domain-containing protein [Marivita sp. S0852]|uniref:DUF4214 domain-containing protein n=1 Tax=Marivita sp. S0852 TaxID=3373893 RepID=UPI00398260DD